MKYTAIISADEPLTEDIIQALKDTMFFGDDPEYAIEIEDIKLEQEPTTKNDLGVDCISREQAIEEADKLCLETGYDNEKVIEMLNDLPTVTPQPRKGHWMGGSYDYVCSNCEHSLNDLAQSMDYIPFSKPKYCPNCGCRMVEPQESEDKHK